MSTPTTAAYTIAYSPIIIDFLKGILLSFLDESTPMRTLLLSAYIFVPEQVIADLQRQSLIIRYLRFIIWELIFTTIPLNIPYNISEFHRNVTYSPMPMDTSISIRCADLSYRLAHSVVTGGSGRT